MAPIIKLTIKKKAFLWTKECQKAWKLIKQKYIEAPINITKLASGISCSYRCIFVSYGGYAISKYNRKE
jgi:hypothetical protein